MTGVRDDLAGRLRLMRALYESAPRLAPPALPARDDGVHARLVVSARTVESHRAHLMAKLRARNRAEMVRHALGAGLLQAAGEA